MSFEKHARTVSLLTLVSRFSGLARDAAQSRVFGSGAIMDAFFIAFQLPNLFRRLFGDGALSASFTPVYAKLEQDNPQKPDSLCRSQLPCSQLCWPRSHWWAKPLWFHCQSFFPSNNLHIN